MSTSIPETEEDQATPQPGQRRGIQVRRDLVAGIVMLAVVAVFLGDAGEGLGRDWLFPKVLSYAFGVIAVVLVVRGLLRLGEQMPLVPVIFRGEGVDVALFVVVAVAYVVVIDWIGFWTTTGLFLFGASVYLDTRRSWRSVLLSAVVAVGVCLLGYEVLTRVFYIDFPIGPFY